MTLVRNYSFFSSFLLLIFVLSGCKKDTSDPEPATKELVSNSRQSVKYKITNGKIDFIFDKIEDGVSVFIEVDVNHNSMIDKNIDRAYSYSNLVGRCTQFRFDLNSWTGCNVAPSSAIATPSNTNFVYTIPVNELRSSSAQKSIFVYFLFWDSVNGYSYYPENSNGYKNIFEIKTE